MSYSSLINTQHLNIISNGDVDAGGDYNSYAIYISGKIIALNGGRVWAESFILLRYGSEEVAVICYVV